MAESDDSSGEETEAIIKVWRNINRDEGDVPDGLTVQPDELAAAVGLTVKSATEEDGLTVQSATDEED